MTINQSYLNIDAESWRSECYQRHGYDPKVVIPVPIVEFIYDEGYCIISSDETPCEDFEVDIQTKCITVSSLKPPTLRRVYLAMAYWYALMEVERSEENDRRAHDFAFQFLLPLDAFKTFVSDYKELGIIDIYSILDVPPYMIEYRYSRTPEYDEIWDNRDMVAFTTESELIR